MLLFADDTLPPRNTFFAFIKLISAFRRSLEPESTPGEFKVKVCFPLS